MTRSDAARALNQRFMALLTVAAKDVRFKLTDPSALSRAASASEESSTDPDDVQPTNFSFNTRQYFYEAFRAASAAAMASETFTLTISYEDPATLEPRTERIETTVADLLGRHERNIRAAETISSCSIS